MSGLVCLLYSGYPAESKVVHVKTTLLNLSRLVYDSLDIMMPSPLYTDPTRLPLLYYVLNDTANWI